MIDYLILLWLAKYREALHMAPANDAGDPVDRALEPGAGLDWQPPERVRPQLRVVK